MTLKEIHNLADESHILYAGGKKDLKRIMAGVEIGPAEIVMAKILKNIDAVIAYKILSPERTIDAAKLLDIPLLEKPIDDLALGFIKKAKEKQKIIPEYYEISRTETKDVAFISLGMNLFLDEIEKNKIKIIPCSGVIRIKR